MTPRDVTRLALDALTREPLVFAFMLGVFAFAIML